MSLESGFPLLSEYIDSLPDGYESYPECRAKGTLIRSAVDGHDPAVLLVDLPEPLRDYVVDPPSPGLWVSAVHSDAIFHAVCDRFYPSEEAMLDWCGLRTVTWARNPLYRAVLRLPGPRILFTMATRSHALFQRGTELSAEDVHPDRATLRMVFPPGLHNRRNLVANKVLISRLTELLGGTNAVVEMVHYDRTSALYRARWDI